MPSATGWWGSSGASAPGSATPVPALDDPQQIRQAGRELLSLALIDSRNALLTLLARDESPAALRLAAHAGHFQEHWLGCHLQRQRGEACDPGAPRLASIQPQMAAWLADEDAAPTPETLRAYLADTLEVTLDLLAASAETDAALHYFRASLLHEDRLCETLVARAGLGNPPGRAHREPICLPAQRWWMGGTPGQTGFIPHNERGAEAVQVPEFEIDAQLVSWAQYLEFAEDGGYDRVELWTAPGWAWVQDQGRRAPRGVEQMRGGVLLRRSANADLQRAALTQAVLHVSRHECEAWCRWSGRRLPTEPEWEVAVHRALQQGLVWGDAFEWVAGSARAWADAGPVAPGELDAPPPAGSQGVLRGASFATRRRWRHPKARRFMPPGHDHAYCGFRSCAA